MKLILFLLCSLASLSFAQDYVETQVHIRDLEGNLSSKITELPRFLENTRFKVVLAESNEALDLQAITDKESRLRAANVFYHMNIAADYFEKETHFKKLEEQIVLRINQERGYSKESHYADVGEKRYGLLGATSIAGNSYPADGVIPWGRETFFFLPINVEMKSAMTMLGETLDQPAIKNSIKGSFLKQVGIEIAADYVRKGSLDKYDYRIHANAAFISFIVPEVIPKFFKLWGKVKKTSVKMDVAMIPEIIYHECAHHYMFEIFKSSGSNLDEGFANYFASKVSGLENLGSKAKKYIKGSRGKKKQKNISFSYRQEVSSSAHLSGEFVYSLLLSLEQDLNIVKPGLGQQLILELLKKNSLGVYFLYQKSDIRSGLVTQVYRSLSRLLDNKFERYFAREVVSNFFTKVGI